MTRTVLGWSSNNARFSGEASRTVQPTALEYLVRVHGEGSDHLCTACRGKNRALSVIDAQVFVATIGDRVGKVGFDPHNRAGRKEISRVAGTAGAGFQDGDSCDKVVRDREIA